MADLEPGSILPSIDEAAGRPRRILLTACRNAPAGSEAPPQQRHAIRRSGRTSKHPLSPISRRRHQAPSTSLLSGPSPTATGLMSALLLSAHLSGRVGPGGSGVSHDQCEAIVAAEVESRDVLGTSLQPNYAAERLRDESLGDNRGRHHV